MYHYIRDLAKTRFPEIRGLDYKLFVGQIEYLQLHYNFISMENLISSFNNSEILPKKAALLTFDDAYTDHYTNVFPLLDKYQIQGSFYVPAKAVTENVVLDVNKIHYILASESNTKKIIEDIKLQLRKFQSQYNLNTFSYYYNKLANRNRYDTPDVMFIKNLLQVELIEELRNKIANALFEKYVGIEESILSEELYMSIEQLRTMQRHGMHIGCHGYDHRWWNELTNKEFEMEIDKSLDFLDSIGVEMKNWTACYPSNSYSNKTVEILRRKGCKLALTANVDIADVETHNPYAIPRLDTNDIPKIKTEAVNDWYLRH